jgi:membrane fusion protein (multidrug efflux system)
MMVNDPPVKTASAPIDPPAATPRGFVEEPIETPSRRRRPIRIVLLLLVVAILAVAGGYIWNYLQTFEDTDDAQIDGHVNILSTRIPGTVLAVNVVENQFVQKGQVLVELDPRDYQVALEQARAGVAQAGAQVLAQQPNVPMTATSTETNIAMAQSEVLNAEAAVSAAERDHLADIAKLRDAEAMSAKAQADLARYKQLVAKEEVSREDYDQRVAMAQSSSANVDSFRQLAEASQKVIDQRQAALAETRTRLEMSRTNAPREVAVQRANVSTREATAIGAKAAVDQALLNLEYTKITAPVSGLVGRKSVEVGMRVQPGQQLLAIIPTDDIWVTANFKESQLRRMHPGQKVRIHVDAFDRDYDGYIESLPAATSARYSLLPPENATGNYVKVVQRLPVRIRFQPGQDPDRLLRPGMSVEPKVLLK